MSKLPQHKAAQLSDIGMHIRRMSSSQTNREPIHYAHQDDYYIFAIIENGECKCFIDFKEHSFSKGEMIIIRPGQVHYQIISAQLDGIFLAADNSFVNSENKRIFDEFGLTSSVFSPNEEQYHELQQIAAILLKRISTTETILSKSIVRSLTETFISIAAESVIGICRQQPVPGKRQLEITLAFRSLLTKKLRHNRQPSHYASLLNISPVYFNEVIHSVTGMNVRSYIRSELVLQAKRLLVHTDHNVKEIAYMLGIDDYAYFSRLFAQETGTSPSSFRQKNLE